MALHFDDLGTGPLVLLLHSSGLSGRQWQRSAKGLAQRGFAARMIDLTGHGGSPPWPEPKPFSFHQDVEEITAMLNGGPPAHLVGHSYGGLVGLHAAMRAPKQVLSLSLFEPVAFGCLDSTRDADAKAELADIDFTWGETAAQRDRWLQAFVDFWGGAGAWAALREEARAEFRRVGWAICQGVTSLMQDSTPGSAYTSITCPARLLTGEKSPIPAQRVVARLGQFLPNAKVVRIPGAGHMAPLTHSDRVNAEVFDLLGVPEGSSSKYNA